MSRRFSIALALLALLGFLPNATSAAAGSARIGVRAHSPWAEFYDRSTGRRYVPDGFNYIRADPLPGETGGNAPQPLTNQTRGTAPVVLTTGFYQPQAVESAFAGMQQHGFNTVRIFVDEGDVGHQREGVYGVAGPYESQDLYAPYVANLIDLLRRARNHDIHVLLVIHGIPYNRGFLSVLRTGVTPAISGTNRYYLTAEGVEAKARYAREIVHAVRSYDGGSLLPTVFAWELANEVFLRSDYAPFSNHSGTVKTGDGRVYDMGNATSRQQCMDANIANWARRATAAIHSEDPDALVTAGFFTYLASHKAGPNGLLAGAGDDPRFAGRPITLEHVLSFTDIHSYARSSPYSLAANLDSSEFEHWDRSVRPVLLGEYGIKRSGYRNAADAAAEVRSDRVQAAALGIGGALFWTWDDGKPGYWNALEAGGTILRALEQQRLDGR